MGNAILILLLCFATATSTHQPHEILSDAKSQIIDVKCGPHDVVWVVQLSDLHFSVHHPDRALDFKQLVGPALSIINPSLVLITGDLTDGKSKDLLTMKQDEEEWAEYQNVMEDVVKRSGLKKSIFYDLRGNHDNFGVPVVGGSFDFFSKYSINGQLGRNGPVHSVTLQNCRTLMKAFEMNPFFISQYIACQFHYCWLMLSTKPGVSEERYKNQCANLESVLQTTLVIHQKAK